MSVDTAVCLYYIFTAHKATNASLSLFPMLCDVSLHMFCYDVAKMTSLMRSGIANVYVSFSTKNANLRVIVSPEKLHCR